MTIQELYEYAKENGLLDYEIEINYRDDGGYYYGTDCELCLEINEDKKVLVL